MCPVCRARFRGASTCSRCGADLTVVMTLVVSAWRLRQKARQALAAGEFARMRELASDAQKIYFTPGGRKLEALGAFAASAWILINNGGRAESQGGKTFLGEYV